MLSALARVLFCINLFVFTLLLWLSCHIVHLLIFLDMDTRKIICVCIATGLYRIAFFLSPWIRVTDTDPARWKELAKEIEIQRSKGKPAPFLLVNHGSFLDGLLAPAFIPFSIIRHYRTMIKSTLLNVPIFGGICRMCGHFPVYFTATEENKFTVDPEKQAKVTEELKKWLSSNHGIALFPEGQVSKNPLVLQPFRRGSFAIATEYDAALWGLAMTNVDKIWAKGDKLPGGPADVKLRLFAILDQSSRHSQPGDRAQEEFQKRLDEVLAGWTAEGEKQKKAEVQAAH